MKQKAITDVTPSTHTGLTPAKKLRTTTPVPEIITAAESRKTRSPDTLPKPDKRSNSPKLMAPRKKMPPVQKVNPKQTRVQSRAKSDPEIPIYIAPRSTPSRRAAALARQRVKIQTSEQKTHPASAEEIDIEESQPIEPHDTEEYDEPEESEEEEEEEEEELEEEESEEEVVIPKKKLVLPPSKSNVKPLAKNKPPVKTIISESSTSSDLSNLSSDSDEIIEGEMQGPTGQYGSDVEETGQSINISKREEYEQMMEERIARLRAQFPQTKIGISIPEETPEAGDVRKTIRIKEPTLLIKKGFDLNVLRNVIKRIPEYEVELKADLPQDLIVIAPTLSVSIRRLVPQKIMDDTIVI